MSVAELYAKDWKHFQDVVKVKYTPLGDNNQPDPNRTLPDVRALRLNQVTKDLPTLLGSTVAIAGDDTEWFLWVSTLEGNTPQHREFFVVAGEKFEETWNILGAITDGIVYRCVCRKRAVTSAG